VGRSDGSARSRLVNVAPLLPLVILGMITARTIGDNSFLWHIRAGAEQLRIGRVLTHDVFSYTKLGVPWRTQSWLIELGYSSLDSVFPGLGWSNWMVFIVGSVTLLFVGLAVFTAIRSAIITGLVLVLGVWLIGPFLHPRPVLFSFVLLAALVVVLQRPEHLLWAAVPIVWVWSAVHGSWILGVGLIVLESLRTRDRRTFAIACIASAATLVTAHGIGTWQIVFEFFGAREALSMMQEWKPPAVINGVQVPYLLLIVGVVVGGLRGRIRTRDLIVIFPFLLFGLSSRRAVVPATIVLLPWAAMCLPIPRMGAATIRRRVVVVAAALIGLIAVLPMLTSPLGVLDPERFPSDDLIASLDGERLFHTDGAGGYLIYADWPQRLVFIDDRAEMYGAEGIVAYRSIINGAYEEPFATWDITGVIAVRSWPLTDALLGAGWTVTYEDDDFVGLTAP
jgi:hypothetical protein